VSPDELKAALIDAGLKVWPETLGGPLHCGWNAYRSLKGATWCHCNDKPPQLIVEPFEFTHPHDGSVHRSVQFRLVGELPCGEWADLRIYSVPIDKAMGLLPVADTILRATWEAAVASTPPAPEPQEAD
jgi:hypothetical protein